MNGLEYLDHLASRATIQVIDHHDDPLETRRFCALPGAKLLSLRSDPTIELGESLLSPRRQTQPLAVLLPPGGVLEDRGDWVCLESIELILRGVPPLLCVASPFHGFGGCLSVVLTRPSGKEVTGRASCAEEYVGLGSRVLDAIENPHTGCEQCQCAAEDADDLSSLSSEDQPDEYCDHEQQAPRQPPEPASSTTPCSETLLLLHGRPLQVRLSSRQLIVRSLQAGRSAVGWRYQSGVNPVDETSHEICLGVRPGVELDENHVL